MKNIFQWITRGIAIKVNIYQCKSTFCDGWGEGWVLMDHVRSDLFTTLSLTGKK